MNPIQNLITYCDKYQVQTHNMCKDANAELSRLLAIEKAATTYILGGKEHRDEPLWCELALLVAKGLPSLSAPKESEK